MTEFEKIKAMDIVDLAIYINRLQNEAIDNFEMGIFPKGIVDNMAMLNSEDQKCK